MLSSIRIGINSSSALVERCLDIPGYIPSIGTISGAIRCHMATVQATICIASAAIFLIGKMYNNLANRKISEDTLQQWRQMCRDNCSNAFGNFCRSFIEMVPFFNISLILYDMKKAEFNNLSLDSPQVHSAQLNYPLLPSLLTQEKKIATVAVST